MTNSPWNLRLAVVEITNACNLRCPHCASDSGRRRSNEMSDSEWDGVFGALAELGCVRVTVLGGEPLMHPHWYELSESVKKHGMELQIITNGVMVTDPVIEKFHALEPQAVAISIDGANREECRAMRGIDSFDHCMEALHKMAARGFRQVSAITTFSSRNVKDFDSFLNLFLDSGIVWQVQMVHKGGERFDDSLLLSHDQFACLADKVADAVEQYRGRLDLRLTDDFGYFPLTLRYSFFDRCWRGCQAGRAVIGIRADGSVLPCLSLGHDHIVGNLRKRPLREIWQDDRAFARYRFRKLSGACAQCPEGEKCLAGCSTMSLSSTGTLSENLYCIRRLEQERMVKDFLS